MTSPRDDLHTPAPSGFRVPYSLLFITIVGIVAAAFYWVVQRQAPEEGATLQTPTAANRTLVLSETAQRNAGLTFDTAQIREQRITLEAPGELALDETRTARVGALVEGRVVSAPVHVGMRVGAGAKLAEIHSHVLHDAWADYRRAQADRIRRSAELAHAEKVAQRAERLYRDKAISSQELSQAQVTRTTEEQLLSAAQAEVRRTEEALEHLGLSPQQSNPHGESGEQISVKSPQAGAMLEKYATNGTAVTPGMPLFVISDLSTLWALVEIDETRLSQVTVGQAVTLRVAAHPEETFPGTVVFIGDMLDPKTRRVLVRCQVPNPHGKLKPHMYATLTFGADAVRSVLAVPVQAIQELDGKPVVFITEEAGKFAVREVTLGSETAGWREVLTGVSAGARVVTSGSFLLKSELVKPAEEEE